MKFKWMRLEYNEAISESETLFDSIEDTKQDLIERLGFEHDELGDFEIVAVGWRD